MQFDFGTMGVTIGAGITYSLTAWGKKKNQEFKWPKFGATLIVGVVSGIVMGILDLEVAAAHEFIIGLGVIPTTENLLKIAWRKILGKEK